MTDHQRQVIRAMQVMAVVVALTTDMQTHRDQYTAAVHEWNRLYMESPDVGDEVGRYWHPDARWEAQYR